MTTLIVVVLSALAILFGLGVRTAFAEEKAVSKDPVSHTSCPPVDSNLDRSTVRDQLDALEAMPKEPEVGAMCYYMAMGEPDRAEYVCPLCGARTLYRGKRAEIVATELPAMRREVTEINDTGELFVALDERGFCELCAEGHDVTVDLVICMVGDTTPIVTPNATRDDVRLVSEIVFDERQHVSGDGEATALIDYRARIEAILGLKDRL